MSACACMCVRACVRTHSDDARRSLGPRAVFYARTLKFPDNEYVIFRPRPHFGMKPEAADGGGSAALLLSLFLSLSTRRYAGITIPATIIISARERRGKARINAGKVY